MDGDDSKMRFGGGQRRAGLLFLALSVGTTSVLAGPVVYVNQKAAGANDGSNWTDAYTDLQSALDSAEASGGALREIWVANGTYKPSKRTDPDDPRSATFQLIDGVALYGGFAGTEASIEERDIETNETILSGDFNGDDRLDFTRFEENALHVVMVRNVNEATVLDGFVVTGGYAFSFDYGAERGGGMFIDRACPTVRNSVFVGNFAGRDRSNVAHADGGGAGAYIEGTGNGEPTRPVAFTDCRFVRNRTSGIGGGIFVLYGSVVAERCTFEGNSAQSGGAIGLEYGQDLALRSCGFFENMAGERGGGIGSYGSTARMSVEESFFGWNEAFTGGAIYHSGGSSFIVGSQFQGNIATYVGGALCLSGSVISEIVDSLFLHNTAESGGGLFSYGSLSISGAEFFYNDATLDGAGIAVRAGTLDASNCTFSNNYANRFGGALFVGAEGQLRDCFLNGNSAAEGGGLYSASGPLRVLDCLLEANSAFIGAGLSNGHADILLERCTVRHNYADIGGGLAHMPSDASAEVVSCLVVDNHSTLYGGGIAAGAGPLSIVNCTLVENTADVLGAGMIAGNDASISSSIVWGNLVDPASEARANEVAQIEGIELIAIDYSNIQGWSGTYGGEGNFGLDPLFVEGDFHFQSNSPCINTGDPGFESGVGETDKDGHPRVLCDRVDMGAYEFGIGDFDCDRAVDLDDFTGWASCATGPINTLDDPPYKSISPCSAFDFDADADIDLLDFAQFSRVFSPSSP